MTAHLAAEEDELDGRVHAVEVARVLRIDDAVRRRDALKNLLDGHDEFLQQLHRRAEIARGRLPSVELLQGEQQR